MRLDITAKALREAMAFLKPFVARKSALPVLRGVKVEIDGDSTTLTGTDLEIGAAIGVARTPSSISGEAVFELADLMAFATKATVPDDALVQVHQEGLIEVRNGRADGKRGYTKWYPVDKYPAISEQLPESWWSGDVAGFLREAKDLASAASGDQARPILCGINIEPDGSVATTDTYRLAVAHFVMRCDPGCLVPAKPLVTAISKLGRVHLVGVRDRNTWLIGDDRVVWIRNIEGAFPKYRSLIPEAETLKAAWHFSRTELVGILAAAEKVAPRIPVRIEFAVGRLRQTHEGNEVLDMALPGRFTVKGVEVEDMPDYAFNAAYLSNAISAVGGEVVTMGLSTEVNVESKRTGIKPVILKGDSEVHVLLMPSALDRNRPVAKAKVEAVVPAPKPVPVADGLENKPWSDDDESDEDDES